MASSSRARGAAGQAASFHDPRPTTATASTALAPRQLAVALVPSPPLPLSPPHNPPPNPVYPLGAKNDAMLRCCGPGFAFAEPAPAPAAPAPAPAPAAPAAPPFRTPPDAPAAPSFFAGDPLEAGVPFAPDFPRLAAAFGGAAAPPPLAPPAAAPSPPPPLFAPPPPPPPGPAAVPPSPPPSPPFHSHATSTVSRPFSS